MKLDPKEVKRWKRGQQLAQKIILAEIRRMTTTEKLDQLAGLIQAGKALGWGRLAEKESIKDREAAWKTWAAIRKASRHAQ